MLEIEIDGQKVEVAPGSTVMDAARKLGKQIPHFCYHKKLSIAANCRMCLVEVEKMPKAVPACATPVAAEMKVSTASEKAVKAQKSVMEFLLINHPLDCPICDQGGECQLQDVAVGYGAPASRYAEEKRVVFNKNLGPLINTDMTRCIHCSRCVRFGQEISGVMELGIANRGEHSEVMAFVDRSVDSELSGNAIDLCPVGALTSKPFRFGARTWEMTRRRSVSPHDSLGSNLQIQVKHDKVMRVLPLENEEVNECWISDRDRFSYEGLDSDDRLLNPRIKHGGVWHDVDWQTALDYIVRTLNDIRSEHGADQIAALLSPGSTVEEMFLAQKLMRGLGSDNIDFRLRQSDFSLDPHRKGAPWLGMPVSALSELDSVLVIGAFLRKDQPLLAQRLRQSVRRGGKLSRINSVADDWLIPIQSELICAPSEFVDQLSALLAAVVELTGKSAGADYSSLLEGARVSAEIRGIASTLCSGNKRALLLGNFAQQHPQAGVLQAISLEISRLVDASFGVLGEAANSVGGYVVQAIPKNGLNASEMLKSQRKAYIVLGAEPALDSADGSQATRALSAAATVIHIGSFVGDASTYADVMLPSSPFTETSGTYINAEGRVQSFNAVASPAGDSRPAWKVLRVLGNLFGLDGFEHASSEAVRDEALSGYSEDCLSNAAPYLHTSQTLSGGYQRIADVPIYFSDALVRRAKSLQKSKDAVRPVARMHPDDFSRELLISGQTVRLKGSGSTDLVCIADSSVPKGCIRVSAGHNDTVGLGSMFCMISLERA